MEKSRLQSKSCMSNTGYHTNGKPVWWARVGQGNDAVFLSIPRIRGDETLDVIVDAPPGTTVHCGAGKGSHKTHRETVVTTALDATEG